MWRDKLINKFGENIINPWSCLRFGGEDIMKECMKEQPVKMAVEIGTFRGVSGQYMTEFADEVITIDVREQPETFKIKEFMNNPKLTYKLVKNDYEKEHFIKNMEIDFVFIDGSHGKGVMTDMELFKTKCNRLLFHDFKAGFGWPDRAVEQLIKEGWKLKEFKLFAYMTK